MKQVILTLLSALVGIAMLAGSAAALPSEAYRVDIQGSWAVAGSGAGTPIIVTVYDDADAPVQGAIVTLALLDPHLGTVSTQQLSTDIFGVARQSGALPVFAPGTRSGTARIQATATRNTTAAGIYLQQIDHNVPYEYASIEYAPKVPVNTVTTIAVRLRDQYGNPVDDRRTVEQVLFLAGSPQGGAVFVATGMATATLPVNGSGIVVADLRTSPYAGTNMVRISPQVTTVSEQMIGIEGIGVEPCTMRQAFEPGGTPYPDLPADGSSQFIVTYTLADAWGNPTPNSSVRVTTSLGESVALGPSNSLGQVKMLYGKKNSIGLVTLSAQCLQNASVHCSQVVEFTGSTPEIIDFTASSLTMASLDANPSTIAHMRARVMDASGNPTPGQSVTFRITNAQVTAGVQVIAPSFDNGDSTITVVTDSNGYAVAIFRPASFSTNPSDPGYSAFSAGSCTVEATWGLVTKTVGPSYKNYPYLRVETEVSSTTLEANSTLDVTLRLIGDGHNLSFRRPVDVVLAPSRAGTMMYQLPDVMTYAFAAEHAFIDVLRQRAATGGYDAVGILSYGENPDGPADLLNLSKQALKYAGIDNSQSDDEEYVMANYPGNYRTYSNFTTLEQPLIPDLTTIKASINDTVPWGSVTSGTINPLRLALYQAVNEVAPGANPVKAVVVLVDNSWSYYGDPLARGLATTDYMINEGNRYYPFGGLGSGEFSEQNMSIYARNRDVRYYVVYVAEKENSNDRECLVNLAGSTGGAYNYTSDPSRLADIYSWIADQIVNEAAAGATMDLELSTVDSESNITYSPGDIFAYVHAERPQETVNSTEIRAFVWTGTDPYTPSTILNWTTVNQSSEWEANHALHFDVGTIHVKETWETTFRLRVRDSVNDTLQFRLFSPDSIIRFSDDQAANLNLFNSSPIITIYPHMNETMETSSLLNLTSFRILNAEPDPDVLDLAWVVNYVGNFSVTQTVSYRFKNPLTGTWEEPVVFGRITFANTTVDREDVATLDTRSLPLGFFEIIVAAEAENGPTAEASLTYTKDQGDHYIRIS